MGVDSGPFREGSVPLKRLGVVQAAWSLQSGILLTPIIRWFFDVIQEFLAVAFEVLAKPCFECVADLRGFDKGSFLGAGLVFVW